MESWILRNFFVLKVSKLKNKYNFYTFSTNYLILLSGMEEFLETCKRSATGLPISEQVKVVSNKDVIDFIAKLEEWRISFSSKASMLSNG